MPNWLHEIFYVINLSKRVQIVLIFGMLAFIAILTFGAYQVSELTMVGPAKGIEIPLKQMFAKRYEALAFMTLFSSIVTAVRWYMKDRKRLLG